jgi:hypothetical protein
VTRTKILPRARRQWHGGSDVAREPDSGGITPGRNDGSIAAV